MEALTGLSISIILAMIWLISLMVIIFVIKKSGRELEKRIKVLLEKYSDKKIIAIDSAEAISDYIKNNYCPECGIKLNVGNKFCGNCGMKL